MKIVGPRAYVAEHLREHLIVRDLLAFLEAQQRHLERQIEFLRSLRVDVKEQLDDAVRHQLDLAFEIQRWEEAIRVGPDRLPLPPTPRLEMGPEDIR